MAYVRKHGNQIAIVSGARDKETGKVQQQILFTFYSRDEALSALGFGTDDRKRHFQTLMTEAYPTILFNWKKIYRAIEDKLDCLPQAYDNRTGESTKDLSFLINGLARRLAAGDSLTSSSDIKVLKSQETRLKALRELLEYTLISLEHFEEADHKSPFEIEDEFNWHYLLRGSEVPPDLEEWATGYYEAMDYEMAEAIFELLVAAFDNYAEGYNYLGLIALYQGEYKKAVQNFEKTVAIGRNLFPSRLAKKEYWLDHSTRPFMRGLMNLVLALTADEQYQKALSNCDRLEKECGDKDTANAYRATIHLNLGNWKQVIESSRSKRDFVRSFALSELGKNKEALESFLLDAVESPHTARILLSMKKPKPNTHIAVDDHNSGLHLKEQLGGYFKRQSTKSKEFFSCLSRQKVLIEMLEKLDDHSYNHSNGPNEKHSENFKQWHEMKEPSVVRNQAKELLKVIEKDFLTLSKPHR